MTYFGWLLLQDEKLPWDCFVNIEICTAASCILDLSVNVPTIGDFEHHLQISVGKYIPHGWVMWNIGTFTKPCFVWATLGWVGPVGTLWWRFEPGIKIALRNSHGWPTITSGPRPPCFHVVVCFIHVHDTGWWFEPVSKILVNWDDYSQYMGK